MKAVIPVTFLLRTEVLEAGYRLQQPSFFTCKLKSCKTLEGRPDILDMMCEALKWCIVLLQAKLATFNH